METVGFIGLGNMGGGMSANIQRAGYSMIVYDLREEAALPLLEGGARLANTPAEVAAERHCGCCSYWWYQRCGALFEWMGLDDRLIAVRAG